MSFDDLPREIWLLILATLNAKDLMQFYFVNQDFKKFIQNDVLWKQRCEAVMPAFQVNAHQNREWFLFFNNQYPRPSVLLNNLAIYKRYEVIEELGVIKKTDLEKALVQTHETSAIKWLASLKC